jgi:hypothetical protein
MHLDAHWLLAQPVVGARSHYFQKPMNLISKGAITIHSIGNLRDEARHKQCKMIFSTLSLYCCSGLKRQCLSLDTARELSEKLVGHL